MTYAPAQPATGARRHAWIVVLVVGVALFLAVERTLVATQNPNFVPSAILLGAAIVPAAFLSFLYGRNLRYDVGLPVVATAAFLGGIIGTVVAGTLEYDAQRDLGFLPMVGVGLIEESSKLIIPLAVLIFFARYRKQADGLLIGVAAGAGFAALETMGYAFVTLILAWTGISATALYAAAESGWTGRRVGGFVGAIAAAIALHTAWDSQESLIGTAVVAAVSLAALGWTVHRISHPRTR
jgi:RsiW-degrading membrane proteinase PrsW (M82 family)